MVSERQNHTANESYLVAIKADLKDINPVSFGEGFIHPGHKSKIFSQSCTLLFYSRIGEGTLILNGDYIPITEKAFFIVPVGSDAFLYSTVPWKHQYIGFTGTFSHDFVALPTVFTLPEDIVSHLYVPEQETRDLTFRLLSDLCLIHSCMCDPRQDAPDYVQRVINKINTSYMEKLSVTQMAQELGLDRSHLSRVFKTRMHISIQDYILKIRITEAKRYLKHGYSVTDTALLSGFSSRTTFSSTFLRETGHTPVDWKKAIFASPENRPR